MILFGHLGLGLGIVQRKIQSEPKIVVLFFLLGTLLPDLIDKPLYYGLSYWTGLRGLDLGLISGTRTFGHAIFLFLPLAVGIKAKKWRWLFLGAISHIVLDHVVDGFQQVLFSEKEFQEEFSLDSDRLAGLFYPLLGGRFPIHPHGNFSGHLTSKLNSVFITTELLGLWFLLKFYRVKQAR